MSNGNAKTHYLEFLDEGAPGPVEMKF